PKSSTLSVHDALPISVKEGGCRGHPSSGVVPRSHDRPRRSTRPCERHMTYPLNADEPVSPSPRFPEIELETLAFWKRDDTFRASDRKSTRLNSSHVTS